MEKKKYYIAVGPGEVMENQGDASFEFEIEATEEDIDRLQELFEEADNSDQRGYARSFIPLKDYYFNESNQDYDYYLHEVYRMLYDLGTEQTKQHIEKMNILN
ncbi:hypothetical protein [Paenibacillus sp. GP183]|uniref:hypothetical protein n=1 Tax=Paenibacillus sp. GP183 TaxID=1882751 RepID=UPI00089D4328|nr:hypothetical protein [Paenibacillus sp. GP183]SEB74962.1 hypothetical protein SAMN05443246_1785 [Paenibacillus sp. GP183]